MKKIMVFDVPAESGGALSILDEYYEKAVTHPNKNIEWIFIVSKPELKSTSNVKVLRYPWIKKSWIHRLYFDYFIAHKLIKRHKIDRVLSLQNVLIPRSTPIKQTVYIHQSLPFVDYRFSFKDNMKFWIYQNIIGKIIFNSIKKANKVIVQTDWMKRLSIEKTGVEEEKIKVKPPKVNIVGPPFFSPRKENMKKFFYPANASSYKNHRIIIEACKNLESHGINDYSVIFTLTGNETSQIASIYEEVKSNDLPIEFVGSIPREKVYDYYTHSILVFPSYIETYGLPLLESRLHKGMILASSCPFSYEVLEGYQNAYYFDPFNVEELWKLMESVLVGEIEYKY